MILQSTLYLDLDVDLTTSIETYDLEIEPLEELSLEVEREDRAFDLDFEEDIDITDLEIGDIDELYDLDMELRYVQELTGENIYEGPYVAEPKFRRQYLATKNKIMADDVAINAIKVSRVSNQQGGITVYIGGTF